MPALHIRLSDSNAEAISAIAQREKRSANYTTNELIESALTCFRDSLRRGDKLPKTFKPQSKKKK